MGKPYRPNAKGGISLVTGDHELEVSAPGYKPRKMLVTVTAGQARLVNVTLQPLK